MRTVNLRVLLVGWTAVDVAAMQEATDNLWLGEPAGDGSLLAEFAGRACYQSWSRPNPATATNAGYLDHILQVGHLSVLEHAQATFYLTGVSRSFTHELVRHRHLSFSQLSQRYVDGSATPTVVPPLFEGDADALAILDESGRADEWAYESLAARAEVLLADQELPRTARRKQARQAARAVLPNATETRIVVTGNYRAWRHFVTMRATEHADTEIREVAVAILRELQRVAPNVFGDYTISKLPDGTEVAASPYVHTS